MEVPQAVLDKAKGFIDKFGEGFNDLGLNHGKHVYQFVFPERQRTGFPYIYLYDETSDEVEEVTGTRAIKIIHQCLRRSRR